jgi:hypothetical protein|tara:strand:+ start:328 stop:534 length:207 start_codon:yes stop_codon:yes gene_type:complete
MSEDGYEIATKDDLKSAKSDLQKDIDGMFEGLQNGIDHNKRLIVETHGLVKRGLWTIIALQVLIAIFF